MSDDMMVSLGFRVSDTPASNSTPLDPEAMFDEMFDEIMFDEMFDER